MRKPPDIPNELFAYERKQRHWTQWDVADKISAPDEKTIRRWEHGEVAPTPYYLGKLAEVFGKSARALGFPPDGQISFWHVPYRQNAFFTGREDILQLLRDTFLAQYASSVPRLPLSLSGLGGVGKSQIALEYAYRYREHYHTVLWLHAASYQGLVAGVTAVADLLDLPGKDAAKPDQLIEALKAWLTHLTRWLLIFDNVENLQLLQGFLPTEIKGHLLLTTLSQNTGTHAHRIAVEPMDNNTGAELLLRRAKLIAIERTLEPMAAADAAIARSLSEDMGGLPLALDQAGAYVEETAVSLSEYEQRYQAQRSDLLDRRGSWVGDSEHPLPVAATLKLSIKEAGEQHPLATDILHFCALLHPDAIPAELFQHDDSFKYGTTVFDEAIAALLRYSLIRGNTQEATFSIHRLVQAVLIDDMPADLQMQWRDRVARTIYTAFPEIDFSTLNLCDRLAPHALAWATCTDDELTPTLEVAELFYMAGFCLRIRRLYSEAEILLVRALSISEQHLGVEHLNLTSLLDHVADIYIRQGKYEQAERRLAQALAIYKHHLGSEHRDTAHVLSSQADIYFHQGKYEQAKLLYQRVLNICEEHLGTDNVFATHALDGLSAILYIQGKLDQAEALDQRVLSYFEKRFGGTHPITEEITAAQARLRHIIKREAEATAQKMKDEPSV